MENDIMRPESFEAQEPEKAQEPLPATEKKTRRISLKMMIIIGAIVVLGVFAYIYKGLFVAAIVNGTPITRLSVIQELEKASGKQALSSIITQILISEEASKKGFLVSEDEVNAEIKKIEDQIKSQGQTLNEALAVQGITLEALKKQIVIQKEVEKLVADKTQVSDEEIGQYIKDNSITIPKGQEATYKDDLKSQIQQQKFNEAASAFVESLRSQAKIQYFTDY
jgi:dGTP triphosphohydrolase